MSPTYVLALFGSGIAAGIVAALLGVGGGILMVPLMTMVFGVPVHTALGASLVAAMATSDAACIWPAKRRLMDISQAWTLGLTTTIGAAIGAMVALASKPEVIQAIFAVLLLYTAFQLARPQRQAAEVPDGKGAAGASRARHALMLLVGLFAGASSGLLGIGGGIIIVPALHLILRKPFKEATATSNLLVGITALTGAFAYWWRGALLLVPTVPIAAGAFVGALLGSAIDKRLSSQVLRWGMALLLTFTALQMGSAIVGAHLGR
ncbi:MAG TPA: sulfite exporter TauE/SafE family protein [Anaerolineae bacterium]|nr:sulfite exporter TauE/SafE family protein [Anaerolineae bacterium]HOG46763.1 sulfite exporter TauE/SafE family protein [Anaerolineae bacterium]HOR00638.1 sulfite exporter TauE/SafE family protein [Anaerolineae bacterium]HPL30049.1 sulfite exporter TauE/SafE family protein [Anaerolineae bacterium]